jgi:uncharacterized protein YbaA (DUF1428 family)
MRRDASSRRTTNHHSRSWTVSKYVDGFVIPMPKKNLAAYRRMAVAGSKIWRKHGALDYRECVGDDLDVHCGTPFPKQLKLRPNETVVFAWIVFKSRAHRDRVNAKVMSDPALAKAMGSKTMPFDMQRMHYGGFKTLVGK